MRGNGLKKIGRFLPVLVLLLLSASLPGENLYDLLDEITTGIESTSMSLNELWNQTETQYNSLEISLDDVSSELQNWKQTTSSLQQIVESNSSLLQNNENLLTESKQDIVKHNERLNSLENTTQIREKRVQQLESSLSDYAQRLTSTETSLSRYRSLISWVGGAAAISILLNLAQFLIP